MDGEIGRVGGGRRPRLRYPVGSPRLTLAAMTACLLVLLAFIGLRATAPSDGTQVVIDPGAPAAGGIVVRPDGRGPSPFLGGDHLIAIDGRSVGELLAAGTDDLRGRGLHRYTVERDGRTVQVDIATGPAGASILGTILLDWPLYAFLVYFAAVGLVVFAKRHDLPSARLFARFSVAILAAEGIYFLSLSAFDLVNGPLVWFALVANAILFFYALSAAIHFALSFPKVQPILRRRSERVLVATYVGPWLGYVALMAVSPAVLGDPVSLFLRHWQVTSYIGAAGFATILAAFVLAFRRIETAADRRQLRWIVWGVGIAYVPWLAIVAVSLVTPLPVRELLPFFAITFTAIPTTVAIAIVRERMFDIDLIVNRTLVFVSLSAILAGIYAATVALAQRTIVAMTGASSDGAIVLATLVVVVLFSPLRDAMQRLVDRRYKGLPAHAVTLRAFGDLVARRLAPVDPPTVLRRLLEQATTALDASGGSIRVAGEDGKPWTETVGDATAGDALEIPITASSGEPLGILVLGPRTGGRPYERSERELGAEVAVIVADAIVADRQPVAARASRAARSTT